MDDDQIFWWDRQPDETPAQYNAFVYYRDLPAGSRSVDRAYRLYKGLPDDDPTRAVRRWFTWSSDNGWVDRATAYDLHVEMMARQNRETAHLQEIDAYQEKLIELSKDTVKSVGMMLVLTNHTLQKMVQALDSGDKKAAEAASIPAKDLPTWIRAMTDSMGKAMEAWATALGVEALAVILEQQDQAERASEDLSR